MTTIILLNEAYNVQPHGGRESHVEHDNMSNQVEGKKFFVETVNIWRTRLKSSDEIYNIDISFLKHDFDVDKFRVKRSHIKS